jgi:hypothetical protein
MLRPGVMIVVVIVMMAVVSGMIYVAAMSLMAVVANMIAMGIVSRLFRTGHGLPFLGRREA